MDAFRSLFMKKIVFTFGRFNPPTTGHHLLANKVKDIAKKRAADYKIFGSSSQDAKRNPLSPTDKFRFMKKILKGFNVAVDRNNKTPFEVLQQLSDEGYEDVTMVVGSDRVQEFKKNMSRYIGKKGYENISKFNVVSAGDRDPDAEGVTGMSASKMRAAASEGNFDAFRLGMPSHVSERDAMGLFKAIRKGMGIRGKISESTSWFDYDEFAEFVNGMDDTQELNEALTLSARRKLSMRMKKTAKKRARIRKMREKRRKTKNQLVAKATKTAIKKIRARFHKGRPWNDVSYMERIRIGEKMKKKKKAIQRISKRLIPAMHKAEKERLQKVKNRMTSNEPAKAIAPTNEHIDIMFEEFLEEKPVARARPNVTTASKVAAQDKVNREKQKARDRGQDEKKVDAARKRGERERATRDEKQKGGAKGDQWWKSSDPYDQVLVVRRNDRVMLISKHDYQPDDDVIKGSIDDVKKGKVDRNFAGNLEVNYEGEFKGTKTYRDLVGFHDKEDKERKKKEEEELAQAQPQIDPKVAKAQADNEVARTNLDTMQTSQAAADMEAQAQAADFRNAFGATQEEIDANNAELASKELKEGATVGHDIKDAADAELCIVDELNSIMNPDMNDEDRFALGKIDEKGVAKLNTITMGTSRLANEWQIPEDAKGYNSLGARVVNEGILPSLEKLDPEGNLTWHAEHSGKGDPNNPLKVSSLWADQGATRGATPKSDMVIYGTDKKGKVVHQFGVSVKKGKGQLASPAPEEFGAMFTGVFEAMRGHCKRQRQQSDDCKSVLETDSKIGKQVDALLKTIETSPMMRQNTGLGMGPFGWHGPGGKFSVVNKKEITKDNPTGQPEWWDTFGPGAGNCTEEGCCNDQGGWAWECLLGQTPEEKHWKGSPAEYDTDVLKQVRDTEAFRLELTDQIGEILNDSDDFFLGIIGEAMTGCMKFCGCCDGCNPPCSAAVANAMLTMSPDGGNANFRDIDPDVIREIGRFQHMNAQFKSNQTKRTVDGKKVATGKYGGVVSPRITTRGKARKYQDESFLSYSNYILNENIESAKQAFHRDSSIRNPENDFKNVKNNIGRDPEKLLDWLGADISNISFDGDVPWWEVGMMGESTQSTEIRIGNKVKRIPIVKYNEDDNQNMDESFRMLTEPDILDRLVTQLKDKGMSNDKAHAIARSQLQKHGVLKKGTDDLTAHGEKRNAMGAAGRAKDRAAKKDGKSPKDYNYNPRTNIATQKEDCGCINEDVQLISFKESTTHGIGSFANTDIKEGTSLGLYLLDLMEDTPTYQRTDFCRFTNHSHKNANLTLEQIDGSFHATVNRDIQEGEELFIDYFRVFDEIGGADVNIIEEVLRWTKGYENLFIPEDSIDSFVLELSYFVRMGDCPKLSEDFLMMLPDYPHQEQQHDKDFFDSTIGREEWQDGDPPKPVGLDQIKEDEDPVKRAKRLKAYNARPEQRARRSARTNERNKRIRNGQLSVGDGKDIDHKDGNPLNNSPSNISITTISYNRGRNNNKGRTNEEHGAGEMGTKELLKKYLNDTPHMTIDSLFKKEME